MAAGRSIVALLTDFGTKDPYVAVMKGVIASRTGAEILDLGHDIAPFDPFEAGWFLRATVPAFVVAPERLDRVVIVAVVDPGVGTARRILAARDRGCMLLAPDNGLLDLALSREATFFSVVRESLFLPGGSTTFHGRDRFAPVAAALAEGAVEIEQLGPPLDRTGIVTLGYREPSWGNSEVRGTVIAIDRFGNAITDIEASRLDLERSIEIALGKHRIREIRRSYGEDPSTAPFGIVGSQGTIEISLNRGSAAERLQIRRLDPVHIRWSGG